MAIMRDYLDKPGDLVGKTFVKGLYEYRITEFEVIDGKGHINTAEVDNGEEGRLSSSSYVLDDVPGMLDYEELVEQPDTEWRKNFDFSERF
ncbi:hypothetical protein HOC80_05045 [archaeon]|jgi:hypothetical protein|nr:hypothetical protein [archaeon]MBT4417439.1 hypothetical protein [archaeon]